MNVIFTCGGTGGHINPAIALANNLRSRDPSCRILFIGCIGGMEEQLVPKAGYEIKCLPGSRFFRKLNFENIKRNVQGVGRILAALKGAKKIIREFQPDVIVGTGGYASFPALYAAQSMGIPTCVHESNAMPGLTTRLVADLVDRVLICFPESAKYYRHPEKVESIVLLHSTPNADSEEKKKNREREISLIKSGKKELLTHTAPQAGFAAENRAKFSANIEDLAEIIHLTEDEGIIALLGGMIGRKDQNQMLNQSPVPQLFILGKKDEYITTEVAEAMVKNHPQAAVKWMENSGHMSFIEEPKACAEALLKFMGV